LATPPRSLCVNIARTKVRGFLERKEPEPLSPGAWPCGSRLPLRRPPDIGEASTASTTVVSTAEVGAQRLGYRPAADGGARAQPRTAGDHPRAWERCQSRDRAPPAP